MSYFPKGNIVKCFGCGYIADIFIAYSDLDNAPKNGHTYVIDNVKKLAEKYNIPVPNDIISQENLLSYNLYKVYETIGNLIISDEHFSEKPFIMRGWNAEECRKNGIGSIKDPEKFINTLQTLTNTPKETLDNYGITEHLINDNTIIMPIKTPNGSIISFQGRNMSISKGDKHSRFYILPKDIKTVSDTGEIIKKENPLVKNMHFLPGIDKAIENKHMRLDLVEGMGSLISLNANKYFNVISVMTATFNIEIFTYLQSLGFTHINLVLDTDDAGMNKIHDLIMNKKLPHDLYITVTILDFSDEDIKNGLKDPEEYIKLYGIESYKHIKPMEAFEYLAGETIKNRINFPVEIAINPLIKDICNSIDSQLKQNRMITTLVSVIKKFHPSIDEQKYIQLITNEVDKSKSDDTNSIKAHIIRELNKAKSTAELLYITQNQVDLIKKAKKLQHAEISNYESYIRYNTLINQIDTNPESAGWITGFNNLDKIFNKIPKSECNIILPGDSHHGKSIVANSMGISMASLTNENKHCSVLYWALDDSFQAISLRSMSIIGKIDKELIGGLRRPTTDDEIKALKYARETLSSLISEQRFVVKDTYDIDSLQLASQWIQKTQDKTGNDVIMIVDALNDLPIDGDDFSHIEQSMDWINYLTNILRCCVIATTHNRKRNAPGEPSLSDLKGNNKTVYVGKIIMSIYNQMQEVGPDNATIGWVKNGKRQPIICANVMKNKTFFGGKGKSYFKLHEDSISIEEVPESDIFLPKSTGTPSNISINLTGPSNYFDTDTDGVYNPFS